MRSHPHRQIVQGAKRCEIRLLKRVLRQVNMRQVMMAVQCRAPVARHVFDHRQHPAIQKPQSDGAPYARHCVDVASITAVAKKGMCVCLRDIQHRSAIAVNAQLMQFMCNQAIAEIHGPFSMGASALNLLQRRQPFTRQRRAQALHAPAFLIDGDRAIAPHSLAKICAKRPHLIGVFDIAGKQDEPKRVHLAKQGFFFLG